MLCVMSVRFVIVPDLPSNRSTIVQVDRVRSAWEWNWHQTEKLCRVSRYVCVPTLRRCPSRGTIEGNNPNFVRSTMTANPSHPFSYLQRERDRDEDDADTIAVTSVTFSCGCGCCCDTTSTRNKVWVQLVLVGRYVVLFSALFVDSQESDSRLVILGVWRVKSN